jgi:hypothetical protein
MRFVADRDRIFRVPIVGEVWALKGVSRRHAIYGDQVHVEQATLAAPSGCLVIDFLVRHPAFNGLGIGKAKARRLWEEFGQDLGTVKSMTRQPLGALGRMRSETGGGVARRIRGVRHCCVSRSPRF